MSQDQCTKAKSLVLDQIQVFGIGSEIEIAVDWIDRAIDVVADGCCDSGAKSEADYFADNCFDHCYYDRRYRGLDLAHFRHYNVKQSLVLARNRLGLVMR